MSPSYAISSSRRLLIILTMNLFRKPTFPRLPKVNGHLNGLQLEVRILVVGVGPHAQRSYIPHVNELHAVHNCTVVAAVDVEQKRADVEAYARTHCPDAKLSFFPLFTYTMPPAVRDELDEIILTLGVNAVIISTEPLCHRPYALWAMGHGLSILMDKPITTRIGATTDMAEAKGIAEDYYVLLEAYQELQKRKPTCFAISSHRRFNPIFHKAAEYIRDICQRTGCPVTGVSASYGDGTFRLPLEVIKQQYHTYSQGYGKVSHSGYHIIDLVCFFIKAGLVEGKTPDRADVVSSFVLPSGFFRTLREPDYQRLFGADAYKNVCPLDEEALGSHVGDYGELDACAQVTFYQGNDAVMLSQISLSSSGYCLRSSLLPNADQYKGNGRVKHESYEIKSGPFQTIYIESRTVKDNGDLCEPGHYDVGTNNHFQMTVFRNNELTGHPEPLEVVHLAQLADALGYDHTKLYTEQAKQAMILELVHFVQGKLPLEALTSNIDDQRMTVEIMSAMYASHLQGRQGENPIAQIALSIADHCRFPRSRGKE